jgi:DNA replication protein DnaC
MIIDDWRPEILTSNEVLDLLEIAETVMARGSLITTSQAPINCWYDLIGVPTLADAILNRVVHNAYRIEPSGLVF